MNLESLPLAQADCPHCRAAVTALLELRKAPPDRRQLPSACITITADHNAFGAFLGYHLTLHSKSP